ncbi:MAG: rhodanese-like domain-containing protein [Clostridia bacterium]|nr:rhodanese-like domain-containing protein [Clostridia bacterium]
MRVGNAGALFVAPGIKTAFFDGDPKDGGALLGVAQTDKVLQPGEYVDLAIYVPEISKEIDSLYAVADNDGTGMGIIREINEENNKVSLAKSGHTINNVEPEEADRLIQSSGSAGFIIIDVRTADEFNAGHIPGAINMDYYSDALQERIGKLDRTKKYLVYCGSGKRSSVVSAIMNSMGFKELYNLLGGISAWKDKGYTLVNE